MAGRDKGGEEAELEMRTGKDKHPPTRRPKSVQVHMLHPERSIFLLNVNIVSE